MADDRSINVCPQCGAPAKTTISIQKGLLAIGIGVASYALLEMEWWASTREEGWLLISIAGRHAMRGDGRWAQLARPHDIPPRLRPDMKGFRQQTSRYLRSVCAIVQNRPTFLAGLMQRLSSQLPLPNYPTPPGRKRERESLGRPQAGRPRLGQLCTFRFQSGQKRIGMRFPLLQKRTSSVNRMMLKQRERDGGERSNRSV